MSDKTVAEAVGMRVSFTSCDEVVISRASLRKVLMLLKHFRLNVHWIPQSDNKTGCKCVTITDGRKYRAGIRLNGKMKHVGYFPLTSFGLEQANEAVRAVKRLSGERSGELSDS